MTIEADIRGVLTGSTYLTTLSSNRVYSQMLPQTVTYPAISFSRISTPRHHLMGTDSPVISPRFQVDCWDVYSSGSRDLANKVQSALSRYRSSTGTVTITDIFLEDQSDIPELDIDENVFRVSMDFTVHCSE